MEPGWAGHVSTPGQAPGRAGRVVTRRGAGQIGPGRPSGVPRRQDVACCAGDETVRPSRSGLGSRSLCLLLPDGLHRQPARARSGQADRAGPPPRPPPTVRRLTMQAVPEHPHRPVRRRAGLPAARRGAGGGWLLDHRRRPGGDLLSGDRALPQRRRRAGPPGAERRGPPLHRRGLRPPQRRPTGPAPSASSRGWAGPPSAAPSPREERDRFLSDGHDHRPAAQRLLGRAAGGRHRHPGLAELHLRRRAGPAPSPTPPAATALTSWELATRLSLFLWNTSPDAAAARRRRAGRAGRRGRPAPPPAAPAGLAPRPPGAARLLLRAVPHGRRRAGLAATRPRSPRSRPGRWAAS